VERLKKGVIEERGPERDIKDKYKESSLQGKVKILD
jgi:hypothetical protein